MMPQWDHAPNVELIIEIEQDRENRGRHAEIKHLVQMPSAAPGAGPLDRRWLGSEGHGSWLLLCRRIYRSLSLQPVCRNLFIYPAKLRKFLCASTANFF